MRISSLDDLLSLDLPNVEFDKDKEIEFEISDTTSLFYSVNEDSYYAYNFDMEEFEEYKIPINISNSLDLPFDITNEDKQEFYNLIESLKIKNEL